jgi:hypothetical protein
MTAKRPIIAFIYDFDGTLSPGNMQEYDFIPTLGIHPKKFWAEVKSETKKQQADEVIMYMWLMLQRAADKVKIARQSFIDYGKKIELFDGVETWFHRINTNSRANGLTPQHYIISSGIKEMIIGTKIAKRI